MDQRTAMGQSHFTLGLLCTLGSACIFGLSVVCTKTGVTHASVLTLLGWRFLVSFTLMTLLILMGVMRINLRGKPLRGLLEIAFFAPGLYFIAEAKGLKLTTAAEGGAILAMTPIATLLLSIPILKEKPNARQIASILVSVAGILGIILAQGLEARFQILGYLYLLLALVSDTLCMLLTRKYLIYTPTERVYMMNIVGAALYGSLALAEHARAGTVRAFLTFPFHDRAFMAASFYLGAGSSVAGFTLIAIGIRHLGPNRVTPLSGLSVCIAVVVAVIFLHEPFSLLQGIGTAMILAGAFLASTRC